MDKPSHAALIVNLLGGLEIRTADGRDITPPGKKLRALIACLALAPAGGWPRERLTAIFWGDRAEEQARASLRQALAEIRRIVGEAALQADRDVVGFNEMVTKVDARAFARLAAAGKLERAAHLYRGDLLDGLSISEQAFEDWLRPERQTLHDLAIRVLSQLLATQRGATAIETAKHLLALEPAHEETHRLLMQLYARQGARDLALRQYQLCHDSLKRELDVEPQAETRSLLDAIRKPVVATALLPGTHGGPAMGGATKPGKHLWSLSAITAMVVLVLAGLSIWALYPGRQATGSEPSIAVLPFVNVGDPLQSYMGDGIADQIIMMLGTFPTIRVVSRSASFAFKDRSKSPQDVARALGVRYLLEGSVLMTDGKMRVTAELVDAETNDHVWGDRYDVVSNDMVSLQDAVAEKIYASLAGTTGAFQQRTEEAAWNKPIRELEEFDYYLRGGEYFFRFTKEDNTRAREIWQEGLARFPNSALLRIKLVWTYLIDVTLGRSSDREGDLSKAWQFATQAAAIEPKTRLERWASHWQMSYLYQWRDGNFERSVAEAKAAIKLVPYDANSRADLSEYLARAGATAEAIAWAQEAIRRDPKGPDWHWSNLAWAYYLGDRPRDAVDALGKLQAPSSLTLAAAYARLGRIDEARATVSAFLKQNSGYTLKDESRWPLKQPLKQAYLDDLRLAGMPE